MIDEYEQAFYQIVVGIEQPAGYSSYGRSPVVFCDDPDDQGEVYKTQHWKFFNQYRDKLEGKIVLDIGCAYGFLTEDLRSWGVDCNGVDISEWAIAQSAGNCSVQDISKYLPGLHDDTFDTIVGLRFLTSLSDDVITNLLPHFQRVARNNIFVVNDLDSYRESDLAEAQQNYNIKSLADWQNLMQGCEVGSISDPKWGGF